MADRQRPNRLLWNHPQAVRLFAVALLATLAVLGFQLRLRVGAYDPEALPIFERLFLFEDYPAPWLIIGVLCLALVPAVQRLGGHVVRWIGEYPVRTATVSFIVLAVSARFAYHAHPLAMDEAAPYMQSLIFAAGSLLGQLPPELVDWLIYPPFQGHFIQVSHSTGQVASSYWPGFALLLTPFTAAGVPWLCNPVIGAVGVWLIHRLALALTGVAEAAGAAALFTLASSAYVVNSISFYSMTAHLVCNAAFVLLLLDPRPVRALLAGTVGGLALTLHNPVPHLLFAVPWVIWLLSRPDRLRVGAALAAGYLPWVVLAGFAWHRMTQGLVPIAADGTVTSEIGPIAEMLRQVTAVVRWPTSDLLFARLIGLAKLWLWAAPAMLVMAGYGLWIRRHDRRFQLLAVSAALTFIGFLFIPVSQGHGWGFRYFHSTWFVLPLLACTAWAAGKGGEDREGSESKFGFRTYAQGAALCGLLLIVPFYLWTVHGFIAGHLEQLPVAERGQPRVVIIYPYLGYFAQDLVQNDPFLRAPVLRVITHGRTDDEAMLARYFPDLVLLAKSHRGAVWGYPAAESGRSERVSVGGDEKGQQK